jgi:cytoskeletal protein CcmA (bactofilin family)
MGEGAESMPPPCRIKARELPEISMLKRLGLLALCATLSGAACARMIAGGNVDIGEPVDGNLYVAGGNVSITAPVSGNVRIAGGDITVTGSVGGKLAVAGGHVKLDGPVAGNATVSGGTLDLGPNARISGKLEFNGGHLDQDPAAQVVGGVVRSSRHRHEWDGEPYARGVTRALWTVGLMLLAGIIAGALPGPVRRMQEELRTQPWLATLLGIVALISIPIAAVIVMITVIGIPLGLLAIMGYAALILIGYVASSVVVSGLLLDRYKSDVASQTAWRVGAAVLAMLVISSAAHVPFVGHFIGLVALVIGVGAIVAAIMHRHSPSATPTPAAA